MCKQRDLDRKMCVNLRNLKKIADSAGLRTFFIIFAANFLEYVNR